MIHRNQKTLNRLNVLSDGVLIVLCYLFASWLWLDVIRNTKGNMAALSSLNARGILAAVIYAIWTVFLLSLLRVYHTSRVHRAGRESGRIVAGNAIALATAASALFVFRLQDFSRGVLAVYFLSSSASARAGVQSQAYAGDRQWKVGAALCGECAGRPDTGHPCGTMSGTGQGDAGATGKPSARCGHRRGHPGTRSR